MKGYQVRFLLETMAVLFEKKRDVITLLDDISIRMEELEAELEDMMVAAGYNVVGDRYNPTPFTGRFDSYWKNIKVGLDDDGVCGCNKHDCVNCQPSYRMD